MTRDFDIIVIGGGHAGVEAALAAVRMGQTAAIITMEASKLALMSCNPAIGGIGKSQLVKEVDALGGLMGVATDATGIQFRRLNLSRGPAVWSTRAQADRIRYNDFVVEFVSRQRGLEVIQALAGEIVVENGRVVGVRTEAGEPISGKAVVVATGTFLGGLIHIGKTQIRSGRIGEKAAYKLSDSFASLGFELGRLKTGTPPRLDGKTIDWEKCEVQPGEDPIPFFSTRSSRRSFEQTPCFLTNTTPATKAIILAHKEESPIFSGQISSRGPRYCPSIEDKFFRFADKPSHQIFLEPEGNGTDEVYPNGFSTALPEEVQRQAIQTVVGLENVEITRPGYAVEYDYCPSHQIKPSLETRLVAGLFFAGQINGTSGYEEAAAQGLMAGVNASLYSLGEPPFVLDRSEAYIGVMIDDLITRSITEPYRMFTSRAEYRLALREDNARDRLYSHARRLGLVDASTLDSFNELSSETERLVTQFAKLRIKVGDLNGIGERIAKKVSVSLSELIKRPDIEMFELLPVLSTHEGLSSFSHEAVERAAIRVRYQGYVDKQSREIAQFKKQEHETISDDFDYTQVRGLKIEAREKLTRYRPVSIGQASRIEGVTPSDLAVVSVYLKRHKARV